MATTTGSISSAAPDAALSFVDRVAVGDVHRRLRFAEPLTPDPRSAAKPLADWRMEVDDAPIFRWLYRTLRPARHLEFGTWLGQGALYCLEECAAGVWTINAPDGERHADGAPAYPASLLEPHELPAWLPSLGDAVRLSQIPSDSVGFLGLLCRNAGFGHRVQQIYAESREWDDSVYPSGFFDTVLIDGGHDEHTVISDTEKALRLVRAGGVILWHDFCPDPDALARCAAPRGVAAAITSMRADLEAGLADLFWIDPSWILLGVRA